MENPDTSTASLGGMKGYVRCCIALGGLRQLNLHAVHAVDAVDEQNQDEDEGDLQTVLEFGNNGVLGDEAANESFVSPIGPSQILQSPERVGQKGERGAAVNSREHPPFDGEGKRDDEEHEETHLCHEQEEYLVMKALLATLLDQQLSCL